MTKPIPPPVDVEAVVASVPTVEEFLSAPEGETFRAYLRERMDTLGLTDHFAWLFDPGAIDVRLELLAHAYTTSAGAELANEYVTLLIDCVTEWLATDDGRITRLLCEAVLQPYVPSVLRQFARMSLVTGLTEPQEPLVEQLVGLVDAVANRAGDQEGMVHHKFCELGAQWHREMAHHNALVAVFECVETDSEAVRVAGRLLKMSVLYETRLKPFILTLDNVMSTAGFFKAVKRQTVGAALKRVCNALATELPDHSTLLDPNWVDLRNAALHGSVKRVLGSPSGIVTVSKSAERAWDDESTAAELERIEALVAPMGAIPQAVGILASRFTLRFRAQIEAEMVAEYELLINRARNWLSEHPLPDGRTA